MKLNLFEKAIKWCDEGLAVSFDSNFDSNKRWGGDREEVRGCVPMLRILISFRGNDKLLE